MNKQFLTILTLVLSFTAYSQSKIIGEVVYLNSSKKPAVGVEISAEGSSGDISKEDGKYVLDFPNYNAGKTVYPKVGSELVTKGNVSKIELVNKDILEYVNIPNDASKAPLKIIVCPKGFRDNAARKYYQILKSSSDVELKKVKVKLENLFKEQEKDYKKITELSQFIEKIEKQTNDSLAIYKKALKLASINKDDADESLLYYLNLLENGKSIKEALKVLDIDKASKQLNKSINSFNKNIELLETRAQGYSVIFDYENSIKSYDTIIHYMKKMDINILKISPYYLKQAIEFSQTYKYSNSNELLLKIINIHKNNSNLKPDYLGVVYSLVSINYSHLADMTNALVYAKESVNFYENREKDFVISQHIFAIANLGKLYYQLGQMDNAKQALKKGLKICETNKTSSFKDILSSQLASVFLYFKEYEKSIFLLEKALELSDKNTNKVVLSSLYKTMAENYVKLKLYNKSLEYHFLSINVLENTPYINDLLGVYLSIGKTYLVLNKEKEALYYFSKGEGLITSSSTDEVKFILYTEMMKLYTMKKERTKTIFYSKKLLSLNPAYIYQINTLYKGKSFKDDIYTFIGNNYYILKDFQNAIKYFMKSTNNESKIGSCYLKLGRSYLSINKFDKAKEAFKEYQLINPNNSRVYINWAMLYAKQNIKDKAIQNLSKAIDMGFKNINWLKNEKNFNNIRLEKEFLVIIDKIKN